jgi:hypothetical protein
MKLKDTLIITFLSSMITACGITVAVTAWLDAKIKDTVKRELMPVPGTTPNSFSMRLGDNLMCWGTVKSRLNTTTMRARAADAQFAQAFIDTPQVIASTHVNSSQGITWSPYTYTASTNSVHVGLMGLRSDFSTNEKDYKNDGPDADVDYIAIGRAK